MMPEKKHEEYVVILDFLPHGYPFDMQPMHKKTAIAHALGKERFTLLEIVPKKDVFLKPYQEVYIGEGKRDEVHHVNGKLEVAKLTQTGRSELEFVIKELVEKNEANFVEFFNKAQPLTTRMHALELLPGLGKKHMWEIIEERKEPFKSFEDLKNRIKLLPDPKKLIIKRILNEVMGDEKHLLFVDR